MLLQNTSADSNKNEFFQSIFFVKHFELHFNSQYQTNLKINIKMYVNEAKKSDKKSDEFEEGESGYKFESIPNITIKFLRYHYMKALIFCNVPKRFSSSKSVVDIQKDDEHFFMWCISAHNKKINNVKEYHFINFFF